MVLANGGTTPHAISVTVALGVVGTLCLIIGYLSNWLSPFARRHRTRVDRLDNMLSGWEGFSSPGPGFDSVPGVPARLKKVEDLLLARDDEHATLTSKVEENTRAVKAAHRRLDDMEDDIRRIEYATGIKPHTTPPVGESHG